MCECPDESKYSRVGMSPPEPAPVPATATGGHLIWMDQCPGLERGVVFLMVGEHRQGYILLGFFLIFLTAWCGLEGTLKLT